MESNSTLEIVALTTESPPNAQLDRSGCFEIVIWILMAVSILDFLLQTLVVLFVFGTLITKECCAPLKILITAVFALLRVILAYALITSVPLETEWLQYLEEFVPADFMMCWFYFCLASVVIYAGLLFVSCGSLLVRPYLRGQRMKVIDVSNGWCKDDMPQVVILMPVYNEEPEALLRAVRSAVNCDYPQNRKHLFISFDDIHQSPLYNTLVQDLRNRDSYVRADNKATHMSNSTKIGQLQLHAQAIPDLVCPLRVDFIIEGMPVTVCRFPHGGKRATQANSFGLINQIYSKRAHNCYVLFIDSDIILHANAIHNFVTSARRHGNTLGMTGLVTCTTSREFNILQCLQDAEYVEGQMFVRSLEVILGAATCLPGALTLIHLTALQNVTPVYFGELETKRTADFHRFHLGEDRYLTYLLMGMATEWGQVAFECSAQCKTDAPGSFFQLLKQRRRWFLGGIVNDLAMISSAKIWSKFPLLNTLKLYEYSTRGFTFLTWLIIFTYNRTIQKASQSDREILLYIPLAIIGIRVLLTAIAAFQLNRRKVVLFTVLVFLLAPVFNGIVILYSIWTWNVRSWGGPRTDASKNKAIHENTKSPDVPLHGNVPTIKVVTTSKCLNGSNLPSPSSA